MQNPEKIADLDPLLEQWKGQEELLLAKVHAKYLGGTSIRDQIIAIYTEHAPRKLDDIDRLLLEWKGEEEVLLANIKKKYDKPDIEGIKQEILNIYKVHNALKLCDVDSLLAEWEGEEEALLAQIQKKYPDTRTPEQNRKDCLKRIKTVRHMIFQQGEFGVPPPIVIEQSEDEKKAAQTAIVEALQAGANRRTPEQLATLRTWAKGITFFQDNVHNAHLLGECCKVLECLTLKAGEVLFKQGDPGDAFICLIKGGVSILEGPVEVVRLFPPATLGERALEEDAGVRTATVVSVGGGVLASLSAETYRRSVMSEKQKRMEKMEAMEKEQAAIQMQARQRGRSQRKKLEERLAAKKEGRAWKGQKTALQDNGVDEAVMAAGMVTRKERKEMTQEEAAVKIQAHIRGRQHRRKAKAMHGAREEEDLKLKMEHEQKTKRNKSKLDARLAKKKSMITMLAPDPESPEGRIIVLELAGGTDKQKNGPAEGHRRDTFPLCNAVTSKGWSCWPSKYK